MAATINLRTFPSPAQINCPHCKKPITLYDPDGSEYVACTSCHSYSKHIAANYWQETQFVPRIKYEHIFEIGTEGFLKGNPYKMIAYMEKKEAGTRYEWREYMLYNYTKGYAFLAEYNGHWSFIAGKQHYPELTNASLDNSVATMDGKDYLEYNRYSPVIVGIAGEFDWDAYRENILASEFINPPYMLVREKNQQDQKIVDWYFAEYIEPKEIAEAFNVPLDKFPEVGDIGANQPNPYKKRWLQSLTISIAALVIIVVIELLSAFLRPTQLIINKSVGIALPPAPKQDSTKHDTGINAVAYNYGQPPSNGNYEFQSLRTSSFNIDNGPAPVDIELSAPVDNNWFEATVELVNEKDNQTWDVSREIDFYHGYDDGESWSEGSTSESVTVDDIPKGKYHINIYPYSGTNALSYMDIKVTANVTIWQNLLIAIVLLCIYPLICWYLQRQYEVNRWMSSDFSPYKKTSDD